MSVAGIVSNKTDVNLIAGNIKEWVTIFWVWPWTYSGSWPTAWQTQTVVDEIAITGVAVNTRRPFQNAYWVLSIMYTDTASNNAITISCMKNNWVLQTISVLIWTSNMVLNSCYIDWVNIHINYTINAIQYYKDYNTMNYIIWTQTAWQNITGTIINTSVSAIAYNWFNYYWILLPAVWWINWYHWLRITAI